MIIPNAHPPSSSFICCQRVSSFSTGYGTFTSLVTVTSLDGRYTVSGCVRIFASRLPRLSIVSWACAFLLLAMSNQDKTTLPFSSHSSNARMVELSGGSCTSTSFSITTLSALFSTGTYFTLLHDHIADVSKMMHNHFRELTKMFLIVFSPRFIHPSIRIYPVHAIRQSPSFLPRKADNPHPPCCPGRDFP